MSTELVVSNQPQMSMVEMQTMAKLFADSGMFPNVNSMAKAFIKIQAGIELGIAPFAAMSGIHIIKEKAQIGAGLMAGKIKSSGKYDYKVVELTNEKCVLDFYESGKKSGTETFTITDATAAGVQNMNKYPKNMLFARAISNGMKFYCPDLYTMPVYTPEEMGQVITEDVAHTEVPTPPVAKKKLAAKGLADAITRLENGELEVAQKVVDTFEISIEQAPLLQAAEKKGEELKSALDSLPLATTEQELEDFKSQLPAYIVSNQVFITACGKRFEAITAVQA